MNTDFSDKSEGKDGFSLQPFLPAIALATEEAFRLWPWTVDFSRAGGSSSDNQNPALAKTWRFA